MDNVPSRAGKDGEDVAASLENLTEYRTSPISSRWFCNTCGAHVLWRHDSTRLLDDIETQANQEVAKRFGIDLQGKGEKGLREYWAIAAGLLEKMEGIVRIGYHIYVGDTLDGGFADHFVGTPDEELKRWAGQAEKSEILQRGWRAPSLPVHPSGERLQLHCQCRAVELYITRPPPRQRPPTKEEWWLLADPTKYLAGYCACESCRRTAGFEIVQWGFVMKENIFNGKTGELVDFEAEEIKGMRLYRSSEGKRRYFCSTCGASVFWCSVQRPKVVDIALGLIDQSQDGARGESWFAWHKEFVNRAEEMLSNHSRQCLMYGLSL